MSSGGNVSVHLRKYNLYLRTYFTNVLNWQVYESYISKRDQMSHVEFNCLTDLIIASFRQNESQFLSKTIIGTFETIQQHPHTVFTLWTCTFSKLISTMDMNCPIFRCLSGLHEDLTSLLVYKLIYVATFSDLSVTGVSALVFKRKVCCINVRCNLRLPACFVSIFLCCFCLH